MERAWLKANPSQTEYVRGGGRLVATVRTPVQVFTDVPPFVNGQKNPQFEMVHMYERQITTGYSPTQFGPNDPVTRAL